MEYTKRMPQCSGIYCIINIVNNKVYIGATKNLADRKSQHFSELRNNKHPNEYLQNSWNKYGEENFAFVPIELNLSLNVIDKHETFWINQFRSTNDKYGYNLMLGGNYLLSQRSKEQIQKSADKHKKPVLQLDLEGKLIKEWDCSKNAALALGFKASTISGCCRLIYGNKTYKGFIWIFKKDYNKETIENRLFLCKGVNWNFIEKIDVSTYKVVKVFKTLLDIYKEDGICTRTIRTNLNKYNFYVTKNFVYMRYNNKL